MEILHSTRNCPVSSMVLKTSYIMREGVVAMSVTGSEDEFTWEDLDLRLLEKANERRELCIEP
jgi:hypothetical protein